MQSYLPGLSRLPIMAAPMRVADRQRVVVPMTADRLPGRLVALYLRAVGIAGLVAVRAGVVIVPHRATHQQRQAAQRQAVQRQAWVERRVWQRRGPGRLL